MTADPKALETIKLNKETIEKLEGLKKTVEAFDAKSKAISSAFREHFKGKIDQSKLQDTEKLDNETQEAIQRLKKELQKQIQDALLESRRIKAEGPRGPKKLRKLI